MANRFSQSDLLAIYRRHPPRAADAARRHWLLAQAAQRHDEPDIAVSHYDRVDRLHELLDELVCCRRCGRPLRHPVSVARHIGPECWDKEREEVMSTPDRTAATQGQLDVDLGEVIGAQTPADHAHDR